MDLLIDTENGESRLIELTIDTEQTPIEKELEETLEIKVENEISQDDWVKRIIDELEEIKGDLGWTTKEASNYNTVSELGEEFTYQSTSYGETPKAYSYESVSAHEDDKPKTADQYFREEERKITNIAQSVIAKAKEMNLMRQVYFDFDQNTRDAKDNVKILRPILWMVMYELSGKLELM
jgi:hypothetical protein